MSVDESTRQGSRARLAGLMRAPGGPVAIVVIVMTVVLLAFGVWWVTVSLPTTASDTEKAVRDTMLVFSIAAAPVMALVWGIAYYSLRHWGHGGDTPPEDGPPIRGNNGVVLTWVLVSSVLTLFLLVWGLVELSATSANAESPLVVEVTGQQWVWSFKYPDNGGVTSDTLVLPVDRPVVFEVTSTDVIHSFWIPEMGIKVDANPGVITQTNTTPNLLGTFNVRCAELCGLNHAYMETTVDTVSSTDFDGWLQTNGGAQ
ncbi:MAG: cytochrome c oxidase subunit II [Actinomycetes bacterium]